MYKTEHQKEERVRKTKLLTVVLIGLLLSGIGLTVFYYTDSKHKTEQLLTEELQASMLHSTLQQIKDTAPNATFTLKCTGLESKTISNNVITYLTGYIQASEFTELYFPADMYLTFNVQASTTGNAQVTYSEVTTTHTIQLVKGIEQVELPFGIYPIRIMNASPGEAIVFHVTVTASIYWSPVNTKIAEETTTGVLKLTVVPEQTIPLPTLTPSPDPSLSPTPTPTPTPTPSPSLTPSPEYTVTPTPEEESTE